MRRPALVPALLAAAVLLAGCTGADSEDSAASDAGAGGAVAEAPAPAEAADTSALARVDVAASAVVRTAELGVRVDDVRAAADRAARLVRDAGGVVAAERADRAVEDQPASAELVLRVPPERFDALLGRLAELGQERTRSTSTEEVGDELVDLESRLASQRASVERVRALLAAADDLGQVVQVEAELTRRTAELESLQARVAALQDRVALSTVVLRLDEEDGPAGAGSPGFLDGLRGGWDALVAAARVGAAVLGAVLPFLPLVLLGWLAAARLRRRPA